VEFCLDYGAFRDLQRHRLLSPTVPALGCRWGWELPAELSGPEQQAQVAPLLERTAALWRRLAARHEAAAAYLVPLAFRQRFSLRLNLREAAHIVQLRSAPAGHVSYRSAARELHQQLTQALPELAGLLRVSQEEGGLAREAELRRSGNDLGDGQGA
jgi:thymidylate synthase ThyX